LRQACPFPNLDSPKRKHQSRQRRHKPRRSTEKESPMADYDALSAQAAAIRETARAIEGDLQDTAFDYQQALANGESDRAAFQIRQYWALRDEAQKLSAAVAEAQGPQSPYSPAEEQFIRDNAHILSDPKRWNDGVAASYALQMRGYNRNDPAYIRGVSIATGLLEADGSEGHEVLSPNEVCRMCNIDPETYNAYARYRDHLKSLGHYKWDQS
jgi:hypothetical protein